MRILLLLCFILLHVSVAFGQAVSFDEARQVFENKQYEQAEALFKAVHGKEKDGQSAYYLGRIALVREQYADAITWMEKAVDKDPANATYHARLSESYFMRISEVGMLKKGGLAKKGKKSAERAVELDPTHKGARVSLVYFYVEAPAIAGGSAEKAYHHADILMRHHPCSGRMMQAMVHAKEEDYSRADEAYQELIDTCKEEENALLQAGMYYQGRAQYDKAFEAFFDATEQDSGALNAHYQVGRTAILAEERLQEGEKAFMYVLEHIEDKNVSSRASVWWRLGMVHELAGEIDKARNAYEQSLSIQPGFKQAKEALDALGS